MKALLAMLAVLATWVALAPSTAAAQVTAVRVWPAPDSTRVTFESPRPVTWRLFVVRDPDRVVLELDGVDIGPALAKIGSALSADDPLIRQARVGRYKPGVIRVVFDVKSEVAPQAFALKPIGEFGHRIVLDLFPVNARDPVAAFLERQRAAGPPGVAPAPSPASPAVAGT
ncbi:MAG: AMIN domain-containing protein, partial [Burkholderiales bacterium]|nr:AMIN domain-containing protein [Burkholderiales bacterium]